MSSILTNTSAMSALSTLRSVNASLAQTQDMISTGQRISSAKDSAATWAISKVMESDVAGFERISESLSLGQATISVARQSAETITDLLTQIKGKIVAAQEENVDRDKIQTDVAALRDQVAAVVGAAQFNGLNMLANADQTEGSGTVEVLASLDRGASGVTARDISVKQQDLRLVSASIAVGHTSLLAGTNDLTGAADNTAQVMAGAGTAATAFTDFGSSAETSVAAGTGFSMTITASVSLALGGDWNTSTGNEIAYIARDGDDMGDVAAGLADAFNRYAETNLGVANLGTIKAAADGNRLTLTGADQVGDDFSYQIDEYTPHAGTIIGGGLASLASYDVSTQNGTDAALADVDRLIETAIDAAAAFGSAQGRLDAQADFISGLTDALKSGIGTLVDADMEETSARLQAQQVQQQLAVQALSIANQAPQTLMSLFR